MHYYLTVFQKCWRKITDAWNEFFKWQFFHYLLDRDFTIIFPFISFQILQKVNLCILNIPLFKTWPFLALTATVVPTVLFWCFTYYNFWKCIWIEKENNWNKLMRWRKSSNKVFMIFIQTHIVRQIITQ